MSKNKNTTNKNASKKPLQPKNVAVVILKDLRQTVITYWLKFRDTYLGASFINLHFAIKSRSFLKYERDLNPNILINYNLMWFLIYTLMVGIFGFTWMIFIPALTNLSLVVLEYVLSVIKRSQK